MNPIRWGIILPTSIYSYQRTVGIAFKKKILNHVILRAKGLRLRRSRRISRQIDSILSKSKGEASWLEGLGANNLYSNLPCPYTTLKFKEGTINITFEGFAGDSSFVSYPE